MAELTSEKINLLAECSKSVFNCSTVFEQARTVTKEDEFTPQPALAAQRKNLEHIYKTRLSHDLGRVLMQEPQYPKPEKDQLTGMLKDLALDDLVAKQELEMRYRAEEPEPEPEQEQTNDNSPSPRPW